MAQQRQRSGSVTGSNRKDVEGAWWAALVVVPLVLGLLGRGVEGGFWSVFLWSIVAFVVGAVAGHVIVWATAKAQAGDKTLRGVAPRSGGGLA